MMILENIEFLKKTIQSEIDSRGLDTLHYVLFDEYKRLPWAFHLFYSEGKFKINGRDNRSYVMGNTIEFDNFEDAKNAFIGKLENFVESNKKGLKFGFPPYYYSPLWDKDDSKN